MKNEESKRKKKKMSKKFLNELKKNKLGSCVFSGVRNKLEEVY